MKRFLGLPWAAVVLIAVFVGLFGATQLLGAGASPASAAATQQQIGMKILLITDSTDTDTADTTCTATPVLCAAGIAYGDWVNTLTREGVPYTSVVTNSASPGSVALPALSSTSPDGTQVANYEGVVVASSGTEGLSTAQWDTLQTFEHQFSVRQVTAYATAGSDEGLTTDATGGRCSRQRY